MIGHNYPIHHLDKEEEFDLSQELISEQHSILNNTFDNIQNLDTTINFDEEKDVSILSSEPIRNLNCAFDHLDMSSETESDVEASKENIGKSYSKPDKGVKSSPQAIDQFPHSMGDETDEATLLENQQKVSPYFATPLPTIKIPHFALPSKLQMNLPQPVIDRCSLYSVIYGTNKEVQDMAAHDRNSHDEEVQDEDSPLVCAVNGSVGIKAEKNDRNLEDLVILDEEKWLLAVIAGRSEDELYTRECPPTFAEAIGEVEPDASSSSCLSMNPLSVIAYSRTMLWKPSRSWWEAKSGKNPWIEPKSHNKRWRYLWPLIHYHKFLAKCIKKLKRNGVDVKTSLSPVSCFLREEVCAVSDHLAATSRFTSEDWMEGLEEFNGWTGQDEESVVHLRSLVTQLPMRLLAEQSVIESALLKSQIDASFLKAMASAKAQMDAGNQLRQSTNRENTKSSRPLQADYSSIHSSSTPVSVSMRSNKIKASRPNHSTFGDEMSIMSHVQVPFPVPPYYDANQYPQVSGQWMHPQQNYNGEYPVDTVGYNGWVHPSSPEMLHPWNHGNLPYYPSAPMADWVYPDMNQNLYHFANEQDFRMNVDNDVVNNMAVMTPMKTKGDKTLSGNVPASPYWCPLDLSNLAALSTPDNRRYNSTSPYESNDLVDGGQTTGSKSRTKKNGRYNFKHAKPLIFNTSQSYHYHGGIPPSPATQFQMSRSPQGQTSRYYPQYSMSYVSPQRNPPYQNDSWKENCSSGLATEVSESRSISPSSMKSE